jgi:hypothetical protein
LQKDKLLDYFSWALLIISILLLKVTSGYLENIIRGKKFVLQYALSGVFLASVWMYLLYRLNRQYFEGGEKRASAILSQFFSIIILTLFLSAFYNYYSGMKSTFAKKAFIISKTTNLRSGRNYIHLKIDDREERFSPAHKEFNKLQENDTTNLTIGKGKLGYEFIISFTAK